MPLIDTLYLMKLYREYSGQYPFTMHKGEAETKT